MKIAIVGAGAMDPSSGSLPSEPGMRPGPSSSTSFAGQLCRERDAIGTRVAVVPGGAARTSSPSPRDNERSISSAGGHRRLLHEVLPHRLRRREGA